MRKTDCLVKVVVHVEKTVLGRCLYDFCRYPEYDSDDVMNNCCFEKNQIFLARMSWIREPEKGPSLRIERNKIKKVENEAEY